MITRAYLDDRNAQDADGNKYLLDLLVFCKKIDPYMSYCKRQIKSYNNTAYIILRNAINLMLPQRDRKQKCVILTTIVSSFIGLAYEGISSFLYHE